MPQPYHASAVRSLSPGAHGSATRTRAGRLIRLAATAAVCGVVVASFAGAVSAKGPAATVVAPSLMPDLTSAPVASASRVPGDSVRFCGEPTPVPSISPAPSTGPAPSTSPGATVGLAPSIAPSASPEPTPAPTPCPAVTIPQIGVGVGPSSIVLGRDQDQGTFTVYNAGQTQESFSITTNDFTLDAAGDRIPSSEPLPQGAASWTAVEPAGFTLEPQESQVVMVTVSRPEVAPPGDHVASINVLGRMSEAAWDELKPHIGGAAVARSQILFPVTIVARIPGEVKPWVDVPPLADATGPLIASISGDVAFSPRIVNQGNVAAVWQPAASDPTASVEDTVPTLRLTNQLGFLAGDQVVYAGAEASRPASVLVLPGATVQQDLVVHDAPLVGVYDYVYTLPGDGADGRAPIIETGHLTVINLQKVALYIVLPLLVLLVIGVALMHRRGQRRLRSQLVAAQRRAELESVRAEALEQARREEAARNGRPW